jgi:beta-glucosidase
VVLCLGEDAYCETPGNITDLTLPKAQMSLAQAPQQTGKPIVLILAEGQPRLIAKSQKEQRHFGRVSAWHGRRAAIADACRRSESSASCRLHTPNIQMI